MGMPKKILIIPHSADSGVKIRLVEIGKHLALKHKVYFLNWTEARNKNLAQKISASLNDAFKSESVYNKGGVTFVECSLLHRPFFMLKAYNRQSLNTFIEDRKIDVVINGTHHFFFLGDSKKYKHIFDLNDLPVLENVSACGKYIYDFTRRQAQGADVVTACSNGLVEYAAREFGVKAEFIPNGVDLKEFSRDNRPAVEAIRAKYGLIGKTVLGYIGRVGEWIDLDFTINFFFELKKKRPDIALLIVGDGPGCQKLRIKHSDIVFTGAVPSSEVGAYFSLLDIGLLPSVKNLFQDVAFHIKLIEYTAAGKMVISSPLEEVKRLGFPNIFVVNMAVDKWIEAFESISKTGWKQEWNSLVKDYDWSNITGRFLAQIEK